MFNISVFAAVRAKHGHRPGEGGGAPEEELAHQESLRVATFQGEQSVRSHIKEISRQDLTSKKTVGKNLGPNITPNELKHEVLIV